MGGRYKDLFIQKNPWKFRFVALNLEILEKKQAFTFGHSAKL